jgi:hypothetical protein
MNLLKLAAIGIVSMVLANPARAADVTLAPTENWTLASIDDWDHPFAIYPNGPYAGDGNAAQWTIFNRFVLPSATLGSNVTHADYVLHALSNPDNYPNLIYPLSVYVISNAWNVADMDLDHHPYISNSSVPVLSFTVLAGQDAHLDLTNAVNAAYHGDGVITLLVGNADYRYNSQDFASNKTLNLTVSAVPEPETYGMLLAGLCVMGWARRRVKGA